MVRAVRLGHQFFKCKDGWPADLGGGKKMKIFLVVLGYVWRVASNLIQLLVVLFIFSKLNVRFEVIVIAVLGLIYTALRTMGFGLFLAFTNLERLLDREFLQLRSLLSDQTLQDDDERDLVLTEDWKAVSAEKAKLMDRAIYKSYIDALFVMVIWIICLYQLFTNL
jgi:hypothetical protein